MRAGSGRGAFLGAKGKVLLEDSTIHTARLEYTWIIKRFVLGYAVLARGEMG